jgi:hypothetical protein
MEYPLVMAACIGVWKRDRQENGPGRDGVSSSGLAAWSCTEQGVPTAGGLLTRLGGSSGRAVIAVMVVVGCVVARETCE